MNNLTQSVANADTNSKATAERNKRKASYKSKFGNRPHMIIPQEDFAWALNQPNSVKTLFMSCWMSDPYGDRRMQLAHNLKPSSFTTAKRIISQAGLFSFKCDRSERDARESVCWFVQNLHGARRNDFWLKQEKVEANHLANTPNSLADKANHLADKANHLASISSQTHTEHDVQNPSGAHQEGVSKSSRDLLTPLPVDPWDDDSDQKLALEEQLSSASSPNEKKEQSDSALPTQDETSFKPSTEFVTEDQQALIKKSMNALNEEYKFDWRSNKAVDRSVAQNLAIEAERTTEEYQAKARDVFARARAKFEAQKKQRLNDRIKRLEGDKPTWLE